MRRSIRVLEFVTSFHVGGTERQFVNLVDGLLRADVELRLACFRAEGGLKRELADLRLPLREIPLPSLRSPVAAVELVALARELRRRRIEVVHTTGLYPNVFGVLAAWLARTPVIIASVRDMGPMWTAGLRRLQALVCRCADMVVTNAEAVAQRLRDEGYDPARVEVIRNGIDFATSSPAARDGRLRRELGVSEATPLVGVVCRLDRVKGLEDFITAASRLAPQLPAARFLIIGGATPGFESYSDELRARADRLGLGDRLVLTGRRDDVPTILPELDVSVLPSLTEGLSNALLESMAAARPVVATAVGGNPELVEDGVNGLLVPASDPSALAAAIERLLASPTLATELGRAGRRKVEREFSLERMVGETLDLYRRLLAARRRAPRGRARRRTQGRRHDPRVVAP